jgi:hypothetical protein
MKNEVFLSPGAWCNKDMASLVFGNMTIVIFLTAIASCFLPNHGKESFS